MVTPNNRRVHARKVVRADATVRLGDATTREVRTWDLGMDGISVVSPRPIAPGTRCTLTLRLPDGSGTELVMAARAVWCSLLGPEGFKVGLVFGPLDAPVHDALARFLA
jgi:hypothetical protein